MTNSVLNSSHRGNEMGETTYPQSETHTGKHEKFRTMATFTKDRLVRIKSEGEKFTGLIGQLRLLQKTPSSPSTDLSLFYSMDVRNRHMMDYTIYDGLDDARKAMDECSILLNNLERMVDGLKENEGVDHKLSVIDSLQISYRETIQEFEKLEKEYHSIMAPGRTNLTATSFPVFSECHKLEPIKPSEFASARFTSSPQMQSTADIQSLQALFIHGTNYSTATMERRIREQNTERFRAGTRTLDSVALEEVFKWYYKHTETAVQILEESFAKKASAEVLYHSLLVAYTSCDLLRLHVDCAAERILAFDIPFRSRNMYMTMPEWKNMIARCNVLCKRQRTVERALYEIGIAIDPNIVYPMSQHQPLKFK